MAVEWCLEARSDGLGFVAHNSTGMTTQANRLPRMPWTTLLGESFLKRIQPPEKHQSPDAIFQPLGLARGPGAS